MELILTENVHKMILYIAMILLRRVPRKSVTFLKQSFEELGALIYMQNNFGVPDFDFKDYEICIFKYGE